MVNGIPDNNPAKFEVTFVDGSGTPFDPTSGIAIKILSPTGIQTTLNFPADLSKESTGVYSAIFELDEPNDWVAVGQGNLADGKQITTEDIVQTVESSSINF